jgi:hypothetical protein
VNRRPSSTHKGISNFEFHNFYKLFMAACA